MLRVINNFLASIEIVTLSAQRNIWPIVSMPRVVELQGQTLTVQGVPHFHGFLGETKVRENRNP